MRTWIACLLAGGVLMLAAGCKTDSGSASADMTPEMKAKMASVMESVKDRDVCSACPGVQHMTADNKCEKCGMPIADACAKCPGVQPAAWMNADGSCPFCAASAK